MTEPTPEASPVTDWRGTPITEGALVIYGAPVGRSIALVEGTVDGFTKSGRVNVRVLRRAYGGGWSDREVVHVGPDRLTIVAELPPTELPLLSEEIAARKARVEETRRRVASHDWPERREETFTGRPTYGGYGPDVTRTRTVQDPCTKCGAEYHSAEAVKECPS